MYGEKPGTRFLTPEVAEKALDLVGASFEKAVAMGVAKCNCLHVILSYDDPIHGLEVLAERSFGCDPNEWEHPYDEIATVKVELAAKHQMTTHEIISMYPHLLVEGDVRWRGGVYETNVAAAASGVDGEIDEVFAWEALNWAFNLAALDAKNFLATSDADYVG